MLDFSSSSYLFLLNSLMDKGYEFQTYAEFTKSYALNRQNTETNKQVAILRHDVDDLPENALRFAKIQAGLDIKGSYYFRIKPKSFNIPIIEEISKLGHEIGYHYETLDTSKGDLEMAYQIFCENLKIFRAITPIETICMHGSPISRFDNRDLWKSYDYKELGILAEPYFDLNFDEVHYLTDTGRSWNSAFNIRDRPMNNNGRYNLLFKGLRLRKTSSIVKLIESGKFPKKVMFNFHPQRWHDRKDLWMRELMYQNLKNIAKAAVRLTRS